METMPTPSKDYHSNVDTSRPFSSVKEAVAVFGERFLTPAVYSPKPFSFPKQESSNSSSWNFFTPTPSPTHSHASKPTAWKDADTTLVETIKKLESELEETKEEVKLLKERESENEVALASLNAELHKNMSKIAQAEAAAARKAIESSGSSPSLSQRLCYSQEKNELFGGRKKESKSMRKKKPIIPLVGDLFWRKKGSSATLLNPLNSSSPNVHWN